MKSPYPQIAQIAGCLLVAAIAVTAGLYAPSESFEIQLTAPESLEIGEVGVLDVSATEADSYGYSVTPEVPCHLFEDGTKLVFASPEAREYRFVIAAAKDGQLALREKVIVVGGAPTPAGFAARLTAAVAQVQSPAKATELAALASGFRTVASMIAAGVLSEPEEIQKATAELNQTALGANREAWAPVRELLSSELQARAANGTLVTPAEHQAAWKEIAGILERVK